jgi:stage II sporulation protein P
LIIHTYGTQCYSKENYIFNNSTLKSEDESINVLCAGDALKEYLEQKGVKVIHDKTLFDKISYSNAYNLSTEAVKNHIKNNPNIKYVIDIQRDSVFSQKGNCIKAVTNTQKGKTAQIAFISGCDENGADFPHWKDNLSLSYALSQKLYSFDSKLSRGVTLHSSG